ncbi:MAG: hypothetical protein HY002_12175 [Candidatus Rokubacteria bacterium]|nr:hypothetical protein [Candidatus Rokubacteria bacterium]
MGDPLHLRPRPVVALEHREAGSAVPGLVALAEKSHPLDIGRGHDDRRDPQAPREGLEGLGGQALQRLTQDTPAVELLGENLHPPGRGGRAGIKASREGRGVGIGPVDDLAPGEERREAEHMAVGRVPVGVVADPQSGGQKQDSVGSAAERGPEPWKVVGPADLVQAWP